MENSLAILSILSFSLNLDLFFSIGVQSLEFLSLLEFVIPQMYRDHMSCRKSKTNKFLSVMLVEEWGKFV